MGQPRDTHPPHAGAPDIDSLKKRLKRPTKAVVTGGMPYANGPLHVGHLAGALLPPDFHARWMRLLIGKENVLFVSGNDDHGSTSELSAQKAGRPIREFIDEIHLKQKKTIERYHLSFDLFSGTSRAETFPTHEKMCQEFLTQLDNNKFLEKKITKQWFDPTLNKFLQDRFVRGECPHCHEKDATSDECESCGSKFNPEELLSPRSQLSEGVPELRDSLHWWLNMEPVSDLMYQWLKTKEKTWRTNVFNEVIQTASPQFIFSNQHESTYKELKPQMPPHKSRYAPGKKIVVQAQSQQELRTIQDLFKQHHIPWEPMTAWAHRSITRDVAWGISLPAQFGPEREGKTLYVWPDSLIAPLSFTKVALHKKGLPESEFEKYWLDPEAKIYQFLGQDNVYFYVLMQSAMWLGSQKNPHQLPQKGDRQLNDVFGSSHLLINGDKMSKSKGNFYTGDQLLDEKNFSVDQIRYFIAQLSLGDQSANLDFDHFKERNKFLAGPLNAAFEKPLSACHSKFNGQVPEGKIHDKILKETTKMISQYFKFMEKADYPTLLGMIENYARLINGLFAQFKPHDDRHPLESRAEALYNCFYILKNLLIMLSPFVPETMERLRLSLHLPENVYSVDELGVAIPAGHRIGEQRAFFPPVEDAQTEEG